MSADYAELLVESRAQWPEWLTRHGAQTPGVWVVTWKKGSGGPHVPYAEVVEEALAAGWVDSRPRAVDERRSALLVTARKPASRWSRANKERVERLTATGLMQPAGLAAVAAAQASGTWSALDEVEDLVEPEDLAAALNAAPGAREHWDRFPRSARRAILEWVLSTKRPETRQAPIARTPEDAAEGRRAKQWRQP
ncbi:uncharacterized protein YdeI (YjbR/CyaY-like superfamily) [Motilibacter peucedani]|uniref:Uncharacterized protein YdeI (YjbR/CyaY-like superfamily) n=1 Tax=Motilibacter peucedani TaxID=598650 RepID=A0A420XSW6_9ACTN|nr:YdeI/OmpD-associated family protein [Motilibacter peucedani]RKS79932.1 uncharacterized protein YdeI (YjbR/CyaY-like superfamily) [Motilibacter peucedani]